MAKKGQGLPYAYAVVMAGPTLIGKRLREKTMQTIVQELQDLVNSYYSQDWPFVVAAMEIVQGVLREAMGPDGTRAAADLVEGSKAIWAADTHEVDAMGSPQPPRGGGYDTKYFRHGERRPRQWQEIECGPMRWPSACLRKNLTP